MSAQSTFALPTAVQSVVQTRDNGSLIAAAAQLWIEPNDVVLDMTYGKGNFWTVFRPGQMVTNDIDPETDAIWHEDFRSTPHESGMFDVVVFDPPYIAQGGRDTSTTPDFIDRYGLRFCPKSVVELEALLRDGIGEAARLLAPKGRLLVKCMDYINGGAFVKGNRLVVSTAEACGLTQVDEFIHYSGTGPQPPRDRQLHSRRAHSFLCVFQKRGRP